MRVCPACTFENDDDASACDVCATSRCRAGRCRRRRRWPRRRPRRWRAAPVNAVEAWHQEGLRLIARETDDRVRTLLRSNLAALVEALPTWRPVPPRRVARAPAARRRAPAPAARAPRPDHQRRRQHGSASRHAVAAAPPPPRERRRCWRSDAPRTARERADLRRARL